MVGSILRALRTGRKQHRGVLVPTLADVGDSVDFANSLLLQSNPRCPGMLCGQYDAKFLVGHVLPTSRLSFSVEVVLGWRVLQSVDVQPLLSHDFPTPPSSLPVEEVLGPAGPEADKYGNFRGRRMPPYQLSGGFSKQTKCY